MKKANYWYPIQVWLLTAAVFGPAFLLIFLLIDGLSVHDVFTRELILIFLSILYGLILSLPVLAIGFLLFRFLVRRNYSRPFIILILAIVSILGIAVTLHSITPGAIFEVYLSYSLALILSLVILKPFRQVK